MQRTTSRESALVPQNIQSHLYNTVLERHYQTNVRRPGGLQHLADYFQLTAENLTE